MLLLFLFCADGIRRGEGRGRLSVWEKEMRNPRRGGGEFPNGQKEEEEDERCTRGCCRGGRGCRVLLDRAMLLLRGEIRRKKYYNST